MSEELTRTSSIGAIWPPQEASNSRVRGFYPHVIEVDAQVPDLVAQTLKARAETERNPNTSRLSMRAVVDQAVVPALAEAGLHIEAALPIAGMVGKFVVYTAWNDLARKMTDERLSQHHALIDDAQSRAVSTIDPTEELRGKGYEPRTINPSMSPAERTDLEGRLLELYGKFDFNAEDVTELLDNPDNTIVYIEDMDGSIISTGLAERCEISLPSYYGKKKIVVAEISEAVTRTDAQGQGLYRALSGFLTRHMLERRAEGEPLDVLYGESNLSSPGVIYSAHRNGRRFSRDDAVRLGLVDHPSFGILEQNFSVNDGRETRPYNDFAVTYIPLA